MSATVQPQRHYNYNELSLLNVVDCMPAFHGQVNRQVKREGVWGGGLCLSPVMLTQVVILLICGGRVMYHRSVTVSNAVQ